MMTQDTNTPTYRSGGSSVVESCQSCAGRNLKPFLFLGYLPPVNSMPPIGSRPKQEPSFPAELLFCPDCQLVQLGLQVDPEILFPTSYPYTSSTTKILRDNFAELYQECSSLIDLGSEDLVVDIGSNDGNLLVNFKDGHRVCGITPEDIGKLAVERGIPTVFSYFGENAANQVLEGFGQARVVTATNVFAHMESIHQVVEQVLRMLDQDGVFITESHYLLRLVETLQYDTVYHEHLRYYSLHSLSHLLESHGLQVFHAKEIPTHGGSVRVYACRKGRREILPSVENLLQAEREALHFGALQDFARRTADSKFKLWELMSGLRRQGKRIVGIGAPSRATTLLNYIGADHFLLDSILEIKGSHKIGNYLPGTLIPVVEEKMLFEEQPDCAMLLSWHIADELCPKLREKGYKGSFIVPLPEPRLLDL